MRFTISRLLLVIATPLANAFPSAMLEAAMNDPALKARAADIEKWLAKRQTELPTGPNAAQELFEPVGIFHPEAQYIDVSEGSGHEWQPPREGDLRGVCPGLNAFANHGFMPRDGYATVDQYIYATTRVVGMGPILALFLSALGGVLDGDVASFSMGGTPTVEQAGRVGSLGHGLSGSHNKYESDASPTRPDLYQAGNDYETIAQQFQDMIDFSPDGRATIHSLTEYRSWRFDQQVQNNPYFFNGPFSGVFVQPAAYTFIFRYMANHSAEFPHGELTHDQLQSWFGVYGEYGNYEARQGWERIPDNWYRRPIEQPYEIFYFQLDVLSAAAVHPKFLDIGGNIGEPNSFTGVDIYHLFRGVFNFRNFARGNNFACWAFQLSSQIQPDIFLGRRAGVISRLEDLTSRISRHLDCPQLRGIDASQLTQFPGYMMNPVFGTGDEGPENIEAEGGYGGGGNRNRSENIEEEGGYGGGSNRPENIEEEGRYYGAGMRPEEFEEGEDYYGGRDR